jgi:nucleoside 2-deoxyribosyltransferase
VKQIRSVYVAGASSEIERAKTAIERLGLAGIEVTSTWPNVVASFGDANPATATLSERNGWSAADLEQVGAADLLWFLVPGDGATTRGGWLEAGFAHAKGKTLVFSGETSQSIFCALGAEFGSDVDAFATICRIAREGSWR